MYNNTHNKATLIEYFKHVFEERYLVEINIWSVKDIRYAEGFKYSFIFFDLQTKERILMDNHYPKSHHVHIDDEEFSYNFINIQKVGKDFKKFVFNKFGVLL